MSGLKGFERNAQVITWGDPTAGGDSSQAVFAGWKAEGSNFPSKSHNPGWKSMIFWTCFMEENLLMEEILHHLGCRKPCKQWEKLSINGHKLSSINSIINFTLGRFNISSKAFVRFVPVQKPLLRSIDRVRWSFGAHRCTVQFTTFAMCNGSLPTPGLSQLSRRMELLLHGVTGGDKTPKRAKDGLLIKFIKHLSRLMTSIWHMAFMNTVWIQTVE